MWMMRASRRLKIAGYIVITLLALLYLTPYLWAIISSFRASEDSFARAVLPARLVLTNYASLFRSQEVMAPFRNSLLVAFSAAVLGLALAVPAAYGFSRFRFAGRDVMMTTLVIFRTFPGVLLALALFLVVVRVHLYDNHLPLILANGLLNLPFAIWNLRTLFDGLSKELEEAAMVEGCNRLQALVKILLPISLPGLAATFAFVFISSWNEYLFATTFITSPGKKLVPVLIASSVDQFTIDYNRLFTTSILATVPIIIVFILIQRFIVSGLSLGSVKG